MADRRRTYVPVLAVGVATAALAAYGGTRTLAVDERTSAIYVFGYQETARDLPALTALSLVVLAAWGVVLVLRGRPRRLVAAMGALAAAGAFATIVAGIWFLREDWPGMADPPAGSFRPELTAWFYVSLVAAAASLAAAVLSVIWVGSWAEMGTRYDRPTNADGPPAEGTPDDDLALWKALDEGRDPTA